MKLLSGPKLNLATVYHVYFPDGESTYKITYVLIFLQDTANHNQYIIIQFLTFLSNSVKRKGKFQF
jgi:hypothetical protein